jgi:hypothetical protein
MLTDGMQSITAEAKVRRAGWGARRRWTISLSAAVGSQIHSSGERGHLVAQILGYCQNFSQSGMKEIRS